MSSVTLKPSFPRWTKRVVTDMTGRDPLGLSRVSFMITDYLLSGIITTTDRARYYSFYTWALWHIQQSERPKKFQDFVDAFRRREAAMALATLAANPSASPVGVDQTQKFYDMGLSVGSFDTNFKVLPSNQLGGYGQYYAGSLYNLGLFERTEDGIDRVAPGIAEELARSFQVAVQNTPYIEKNLYLEKVIPEGDLMKSSEALSLDSLSHKFANEERNRLKQIFFGLDEQRQGEDTVLRRQTLTLLLHIISEFENRGYTVNATRARRGYLLDQYLLYPTYYGCLWPTENKIHPYKVPNALNLCSNLWRQFCLHQFFCQAIEDLLCGVLEAVGSETNGLSVDEIAKALSNREFASFLAVATGKRSDTPSEFLSAIGIAEIPREEFSLNYQKRLSPIHPLSEAQILFSEANIAAEQAARGVLMLGILYGKWRGTTSDVAFRYVAQNANTQLWTGNLLSTLDHWFDPTATWAEVLMPLLEEFVLNQHDRIVYEKRRLDSSWLMRTEGRIFKEQDYEPVWRNSRFFNCVSILADLKLVRIDEEKQASLTVTGIRMLEKLLEHG